MARFEGRTVLITGAAGGFGREAARRYAAEGARLALSDVATEPLQALAHDLASGGADVLAEPLDVTDEDAVAAYVATVLDRFGRLDVAVNNAGIGQPMGPITRTDAEVFDRVMRVNVRSVFLGMKHQIPPMRAAGEGAILNVASAAGLVGAGHLAAYAASKHAVVGLTRAGADEVARHGIRINALCPSFAVTPLFDEMADEVAARHSLAREDAYTRIASRIPMARIASPAEIVEAMLFITAPGMTFMTGQAIAVDGGLTAV